MTPSSAKTVHYKNDLRRLTAMIGAMLGLTGAGGGILAVPAIVVGMGWPMQQATPVALIAVASSAGIGALEAFRKRLVRYRAAFCMALWITRGVTSRDR